MAEHRHNVEEQISLIWAELKWHKWLLLAVLGASLGHYVGLDGTAAHAASHLMK